MSMPEGENLPGRSFLSLLATDAPDDDAEIVILDEYGPVRMIRTRNWKYVHRYRYGRPQLFHMENDPMEHTNLVDDPAQRDRVIEMRSRLETWFQKYVSPDVDCVREDVIASGQVDLAGGLRQVRKGYEQEQRLQREEANRQR